MDLLNNAFFDEVPVTLNVTDEISIEQVRPGLFCVRGRLHLDVLSTIHSESDDSSPYSEDSSSSTSSKTTETQLREFRANFAIYDQLYALNAFSTKPNQNLMAQLKLTKSKPAADLPNNSKATIKNKSKKGRKVKQTKQDKQISEVEKDSEECLLYAWASIEEMASVMLVQTSPGVCWESSPFGLQHQQKYRSYRSLIPQELKLSLWMDFGAPESKAQRRQLSQLKSLFVNQTLCDVTFQLTEREQIGAHVAILSAASPVFAAMFQHDLEETRTKTVRVDDFEPEVFKCLLSYMYDGKVASLDNEDILQELLVASDKYGIEGLKNDCEYYLESYITVENVLVLLVFADKHSCPRLYKITLEYAAKHSDQICFQKNWKELMIQHPSICLELTQKMAKKPVS